MYYTCIRVQFEGHFFVLFHGLGILKWQDTENSGSCLLNSYMTIYGWSHLKAPVRTNTNINYDMTEYTKLTTLHDYKCT
jgi:hypothetical protein